MYASLYRGIAPAHLGLRQHHHCGSVRSLVFGQPFGALLFPAVETVPSSVFSRPAVAAVRLLEVLW
jgi:hypothetical protein